MEDFSIEIVEAISEYYRKDGEEGKELTKDILFYLYHNTENNKLRSTIVDWFNSENYCISCGSKLSPYEWYDTYTEEHRTTYLCSCCDRREEIKDGNYEIPQ